MSAPNPIALSPDGRAWIRREVARLVRRRYALGITQCGLAERIGCSANTVLAWERGYRLPTLDAWVAWRVALGRSIP